MLDYRAENNKSQYGKRLFSVQELIFYIGTKGFSGAD